MAEQQDKLSLALQQELAANLAGSRAPHRERCDLCGKYVNTKRYEIHNSLITKQANAANNDPTVVAVVHHKLVCFLCKEAGLQLGWELIPGQYENQLVTHNQFQAAQARRIAQS